MTPTVLVDALATHFGGGLTFLTQQLRALRRADPDLGLRIVAAPWNAGPLREVAAALDGDPVPLTVAPVPNAAAHVAWEQTVLAWRHRRGEVLYSPGNAVPLVDPRGPSVLCVQNPNLVGAGGRERHNLAWNRRARRALTQASIGRADAVVAISHALAADILADRPEVADRLHVVPSGAPTWREPARRPGDWPPFGDRPFIVQVANFAPHKRHELTVTAWARACASLEDPPDLVLAGDLPTELRARLVDLAPATGPARLVCTGGVVGRAAVRWLWANAALAVSPAVLEAHPLTPAEAGSEGCPLLLADIPAHREVAGAHATFVAPDDAHAWTAALIDALAAGPPPRAPWSPTWTWDDHGAALARVLRGVAP